MQWKGGALGHLPHVKKWKAAGYVLDPRPGGGSHLTYTVTGGPDSREVDSAGLGGSTCVWYPLIFPTLDKGVKHIYWKTSARQNAKCTVTLVFGTVNAYATFWASNADVIPTRMFQLMCNDIEHVENSPDMLQCTFYGPVTCLRASGAANGDVFVLRDDDIPGNMLVWHILQRSEMSVPFEACKGIEYRQPTVYGAKEASEESQATAAAWASASPSPPRRREVLHTEFPTLTYSPGLAVLSYSVRRVFVADAMKMYCLAMRLPLDALGCYDGLVSAQREAAIADIAAARASGQGDLEQNAIATLRSSFEDNVKLFRCMLVEAALHLEQVSAVDPDCRQVADIKKKIAKYEALLLLGGNEDLFAVFAQVSHGSLSPTAARTMQTKFWKEFQPYGATFKDLEKWLTHRKLNDTTDVAAAANPPAKRRLFDKIGSGGKQELNDGHGHSFAKSPAAAEAAAATLAAAAAAAAANPVAAAAANAAAAALW